MATLTTTVTQIERHLTSNQEREVRASAEPTPPSPPPNPPIPPPSDAGGPPDDDPPGPPDGDGPGDPGGPPDDEPGDDDPINPDADPDAEISNQELRKVLLAFTKMKTPKKTPFKPKEPDVFTGSTPAALRLFIFQCQIYFDAKKAEFTEDANRVFFAISFLRGPALEYFEPFIIQPDRTKHFDFLDSWTAFVQKLTNQFGSYSPVDDDEDALTSIPFPEDGKATRYFIEFAKYESRVEWDQRALRKVIKEVIPSRITDELKYSREDTSTFEGFKKAVMKIDNDYWKKKQDDANKKRQLKVLQDRYLRAVPRQDPKRSSGTQKPSTNPSIHSSSHLNPSHQHSSNFSNKPRPKPNGSRPNFSKPFTPSTASSSSSAPAFTPRNDHICKGNPRLSVVEYKYIYYYAGRGDKSFK
jgi:hypothetical protein